MTKSIEEKVKFLEEKVKALEEKYAALEKSAGKKKRTSNPDRKPSEYNMFMKKTYEELKKENPEMSHQERFSECAKKWSSSKNK